MIRALILDLDNTIFPTNSIDPQVVQPFFDTLERTNDVLSPIDFALAKKELYVMPFDKVAKQYGFSQNMIEESLNALENIHFEMTIFPYQDYDMVKKIPLEKFLVTTGITTFQRAKIKALDIAKDFKKIIIDDPMKMKGGKVKAFQVIMEEFNFAPKELLVIGDTPTSEIQAGKELGIPTLLIDRKFEGGQEEEGKINSFKEVITFLKKLK